MRNPFVNRCQKGRGPRTGITPPSLLFRRAEGDLLKFLSLAEAKQAKTAALPAQLSIYSFIP